MQGGFLLLPLVLAGTGTCGGFTPLPSAMLPAVMAGSMVGASGAAKAIRELAAASGVAVLGLVFTDHRRYALRGFRRRIRSRNVVWSGLAADGVLAAVALPRAAVGRMNRSGIVPGAALRVRIRADGSGLASQIPG